VFLDTSDETTRELAHVLYFRGEPQKKERCARIIVERGSVGGGEKEKFS